MRRLLQLRSDDNNAEEDDDGDADDDDEDDGDGDDNADLPRADMEGVAGEECVEKELRTALVPSHHLLGGQKW